MTAPSVLSTQLALTTDRCLVAGVINVTPDSFSDGGRYAAVDQAVARAHELVSQGADFVDIGGESTRPGAGRVDPGDESARVVPVIEQVASDGVVVSIDTTRAQVARAGVVAGARLINDVSGGLADPLMLATAAELAVPYVLMHWRGASDVMDSLAFYDDVVVEVAAELSKRVDAALAAGIAADRIIIDPGFGFAKSVEQNWRLLAGLSHLVNLGFPVWVGAARKRFLATAVTAPPPSDAPMALAAQARDAATAATSTVAALAGAWAVRVHEVSASADAVRVAAQLHRAERAQEREPHD